MTAAERLAAIRALAATEVHDTALPCVHHLGDHWVRWNDVRALLAEIATDPDGGAPAATTGDDAESRPASAPPSDHPAALVEVLYAMTDEWDEAWRSVALSDDEPPILRQVALAWLSARDIVRAAITDALGGAE